MEDLGICDTCSNAEATRCCKKCNECYCEECIISHHKEKHIKKHKKKNNS